MQTEAPVGHYVRLGLFMPTWKEIRTFYGLIQGILILSAKIEDKNVLIWLDEGRNGLVFEHSSEIAPLKVLIYNKGLHFSSIRVKKVLIFPPARTKDLSIRMLHTLFVAITDVLIRKLLVHDGRPHALLYMLITYASWIKYSLPEVFDGKVRIGAGGRSKHRIL